MNFKAVSPSARRLPLLLLLFALLTVFLFGNDRGQFYRRFQVPWRGHSTMTSNYLAVTANWSLEHRFLGFERRTLNADGTPSYVAYNRFPPVGYALIKLAILPFPESLSQQIHAARYLMLLCFAGAAILAYLSLKRLVADRWIALTATLLPFSSGSCLFFNDIVATEGMPDLFGVMLVFHGMVVFAQEGRFRQLLAKTGAAVLLGWHVFALVLPFVVLGIGRAAFSCFRSPSPPSAGRPRRLAKTLIRSRALWLGTAALLFGMLVLTFNFGNEYLALDGETRLTELPSFRSMIKRMGGNADWNAENTSWLVWPHYLRKQFYHVGRTSVPYALTGYGGVLYKITAASAGVREYVLGIVGVGMVGGCLLMIPFARSRVLFATLALSGFCWTLPMRHSAAFHSFEGVFYVGIPLAFFSLVLVGMRRRWGGRFSAGLSGVALLTFGVSSWEMSRVGHDAEAAETRRILMDDFEAIRRIAHGKTVYVPQRKYDPSFSGARSATSYYLAGSTIIYGQEPGERDRRASADFIITRDRQEGCALLTPHNKRRFLYDRAVFDEESGETDACSRPDDTPPSAFPRKGESTTGIPPSRRAGR